MNVDIGSNPICVLYFLTKGEKIVMTNLEYNFTIIGIILGILAIIIFFILLYFEKKEMEKEVKRKKNFDIEKEINHEY